MSKPIKRKCTQCGEVKLFRADQKTCGCPKPSTPPKDDPLCGRYFCSPPNGDGERVMGRIVSRISPNMYLVSFNDLFEGEELWHDKIVPLSAMCDWEVSDIDRFKVWWVVRSMQAEESAGEE